MNESSVAALELSYQQTNQLKDQEIQDQLNHLHTLLTSLHSQPKPSLPLQDTSLQLRIEDLELKLTQ